VHALGRGKSDKARYKQITNTFIEMNFLAHIYLSGDNEKLMVGNFIADFVKGRAALEKFESEIIKGIDLHRAIDEYTDSHPIVLKSKVRLRPKYRHYSGVIVDVFYDHFLSKFWKSYHSKPLADFAEQTYSTIQRYSNVIPTEVNRMLPYMVRGNWLVNYAKTEGIHRALSGMSSRTPYESKMDEAVSDLINYYDEFKKEFEEFFPELKSFVQSKID
jgi:acyl carrier protein phosphodiesterase